MTVRLCRSVLGRLRVTMFLAAGMITVWLSAGLGAEDWPEWRGDGRLAIRQETGIVDALQGQLKVVWRMPIRGGYAGPAVADGRVFVTDWGEDSASCTMDGIERVLALDEGTEALLWSYEWPATYRMVMGSYAIGPRATPTVDGERVCVLGATGWLFCLDVRDGAVLWEKDHVADYGTSIPVWGTSSPPLVDGDRLIAVVAGGQMRWLSRLTSVPGTSCGVLWRPRVRWAIVRRLSMRRAARAAHCVASIGTRVTRSAAGRGVPGTAL